MLEIFLEGTAILKAQYGKSLCGFSTSSRKQAFWICFRVQEKSSICSWMRKNEQAKVRWTSSREP